VLTGAGCGSAVKKTRNLPVSQVRPLLEATAEELISRYNEQARAVRSLNARIEIRTETGSAYSGVIETYHEVNGFVLAQKPASIRMIGQAPVVASNIFDMVSDGESFHIFIPPKNKFIVGPTRLARPAKKPIENLRPQHLVDALFWPEIGTGEPTLIEEFNAAPERFYILTLIRPGPPLEVARKIWFDRSDLNVARVETFAAGGKLEADIHYGEWQPFGEIRFPREIALARPHDDYTLNLSIKKLTLNEEISADRFRLEQPPGTELIKVGEEPQGEKPAVQP
jgi:outer membrane lipoprotein-sorting protein